MILADTYLPTMRALFLLAAVHLKCPVRMVLHERYTRNNTVRLFQIFTECTFWNVFSSTIFKQLFCKLLCFHRPSVRIHLYPKPVLSICMRTVVDRTSGFYRNHPVAAFKNLWLWYTWNLFSFTFILHYNFYAGVYFYIYILHLIFYTTAHIL